jgi:threonine efflux protein
MPPAAMMGSVAGLWLVAVAIPGPNFFAVARLAVLGSRGQALAAVAAIGIGSTMWGLAGFFGVHALFRLAPGFYAGAKLAGAGYLAYVGLRVALGARGEAVLPRGAGFRLGLLTSLSNPKSALLVASLFSAVMPPDAPLGVGLVTVGEMVAISLGWYALVACAISAAPVAGVFRRAGRWIDRAAGAIFVGFGVRLAWGTLRP